MGIGALSIVFYIYIYMVGTDDDHDDTGKAVWC